MSQKFSRNNSFNLKMTILGALLIFIVEFLFPQYTLAQILPPEGKIREERRDSLAFIQKEPILQALDPEAPENILEPKRTFFILVTAYSSTPDQTDASPFLTASGTLVHDGLVATNFLPFGTLIRFPERFGDKLFRVEDRMNPRYFKVVDIWMPRREEARAFGVKWLKMEIY